MPMPDLSLCRSALFLPASNPRAIEKARELAADLVILDLEDSVKPADKAAAREAAMAAAKAGFGGRLVAIRINGTGTPAYGEDAIAVRQSPADFVLLPKVDSPKQVADTAWLTRKPVLAMIETARGVIDAAAIAPATRGLIAGTNDLGAELRIPPGAGRSGLAYALQRIVMAARAAGVAAFDGVYNRLDDAEGLAAECEEGRAFGFDGKSLIHPGQIETANRVFGPSAAEIEAAQRLIAAATGGAERHEGQMIEALHVEQARRLLAKARVEACQPPPG
jgi:citrate lyase subunit beta/citryl-CoA lyase